MAFFVVAVVAVVAAVAGPLYLTATDQAIVSDTLTGATAENAGVSITDLAGHVTPPSALLADAAKVPGGFGTSRTDRFESPIVTTLLPAAVFSPLSGRPDAVDLVSRTGACKEVTLVSGHCPTSPFQVAISTRSAVLLKARVGSVITPLPTVTTHSLKKRPPPLHLVVSGLYAPGDDNAPIWWGTNYFLYGASSNGGQQLDDGWVTPQGAASLAAQILPTSWLELPLRISTVTSTNASNVLSSLASFEATTEAHGNVVVGSGLPTLLVGAQTQEHDASPVVIVVSLLLVLLALLVLYSVAQSTSALRANDVRVAELRGLPRGRVAVLALREPVLLLVLAVPAGIALAWASVSLVDSQVIGISAPRFDTLALASALITLAAGIVSAALGSRALLRSRITEESLDAAAKRRARNAAVVDALGLALAVAGGVDLVGQHNHQVGTADPTTLIGPGLLALGAGILGARLLPFAADGVARAYRWTRHIALSLAATNVSRRENVARRIVIPTIATGLLVFSITGLAVVRRNDAMQAGFQEGAPVVLQVDVRPGVNFLGAVEAADPSGREAMAAVSVQASDGLTLAVDASRLAAVMSWPKDLSSMSAADIARALRPPTTPPVMVPNSDRLELTVDLATALKPAPDLQMQLYDEQYPSEFTVDFGLLRQGRHTYSASLLGACPMGCRLDYFTLLWTPGGHHAPPGAHHTVLHLISMASRRDGVTTALPMRFSQSGAWSGTDAAAAETPGGLVVESDLADSPTPPEISLTDVPTLLPAVVTTGLAQLDANPAQPGEFQAVGIDQNQIDVHSVAYVPALPRLGATGSMVDLDFAQLVESQAPAGATFEIWCAHRPTSALIARLAQRGVTVTGSTQSATYLHEYQHSGDSLAFDLFGFAAAAALLLALGALLFSTASTARSRGIELSGLTAVGVSRRALRASIVIESLMVSLVGTLLGWGAGVAGASLAIASLPEFALGRVGPPLELGLPWLDLVACGAVVLVAVTIAAAVSAVLVMRQVRPDNLRLSP